MPHQSIVLFVRMNGDHFVQVCVRACVYMCLFIFSFSTSASSLLCLISHLGTRHILLFFSTKISIPWTGGTGLAVFMFIFLIFPKIFFTVHFRVFFFFFFFAHRLKIKFPLLLFFIISQLFPLLVFRVRSVSMDKHDGRLSNM